MQTNNESTPTRGQNRFMRTVNELEIEPGLNLRIPTQEAIDEKLQSIIANGVITDFIVRPKKGNAKSYIIYDGHTRFMAIQKGIAEGLLPEDIRIPCTSSVINSDVDQVVIMFTANSGTPLLPLEKGEGYRRLMNFGKTVAEIAKLIGVSQQHVHDCLALMDANSGLKKLVVEKKVSATLVAQQLREDDSDTVQKRIETALVSTGKNKVTAQDMPIKADKPKYKQMEIEDNKPTPYDVFRSYLKVNRLPHVLNRFNELFPNK